MEPLQQELPLFVWRAVNDHRHLPFWVGEKMHEYGYDNFQCEFCPATFPQYATAEIHERTHHPQEVAVRDQAQS